MNDSALATCRQIIARHSKSFALASRLLPRAVRADTVALYAWCRRADDLVDLVPPSRHTAELSRLQRELESVYRGELQSDATLAAFQAVVRRRAIPQRYPAELLEGLRMDVAGVRYLTVDTLLLYCFRVAGVVGLMMCHVLGVSHVRALRHAAHLGIGMQLTNICRDVAEDWARGRLYLPATLLESDWTVLDRSRGHGPTLSMTRTSIRRAVSELRALSEVFYQSADAGLGYLPWRAALAVRTARLVYSAIGRRIEKRHDDVLGDRVVVSTASKLILVLLALAAAVIGLPRALLGAFRPADLSAVVRYPYDVLPV